MGLTPDRASFKAYSSYVVCTKITVCQLVLLAINALFMGGHTSVAFMPCLRNWPLTGRSG
jgi:hypothetical protein